LACIENRVLESVFFVTISKKKITNLKELKISNI
jgi:hypothetical protein